MTRKESLEREMLRLRNMAERLRDRARSYASVADDEHGRGVVAGLLDAAIQIEGELADMGEKPRAR